MKNILETFFLSVMLAVVVGGGCMIGNQTTVVYLPEFPTTYKTYTSTDGWSIKYPGNWMVDETTYETSGSVGFVATSSTAGFRPNFSVTRTKTEFSADAVDYDDLKSTIKTVLESSGGTDVNASVIDLPLGEATRGDADLMKAGLALKITQVQIYRDYAGFVLNFMSSVADYDTYKDDAELMIQGFDPGL